jgi:electron transfer flavoprotein alpha subunit
VAEDPSFSGYAADAAVRFCEDLVGREAYDAVLFPASAQGKDLAPRAAARLDLGLATEVISVGIDDGRPVATRPMFAGKAIATVAFSELPALISVRPNVFRPKERPADGSVEVVASR